MRKAGIVILLLLGFKLISQGQVNKPTATFEKKEVVAYYYDKMDNKIPIHGKLKLIIGVYGKAIRLSFQEKEKKVRKDMDDMNSFVIGKDSFALISNFDYGVMSIEADFVKVADTGFYTVYLPRWKNMDTDRSQSYEFRGMLIKKRGVEYFESFPFDSFMGAKIRRERVILLIEDNKELVAKVNEMNKSTFKESYVDIFKEYNDWVEVEN